MADDPPLSLVDRDRINSRASRDALLKMQFVFQHYEFRRTEVENAVPSFVADALRTLDSCFQRWLREQAAIDSGER